MRQNKFFIFPILVINELNYKFNSFIFLREKKLITQFIILYIIRIYSYLLIQILKTFDILLIDNSIAIECEDSHPTKLIYFDYFVNKKNVYSFLLLIS